MFSGRLCGWCCVHIFSHSCSHALPISPVACRLRHLISDVGFDFELEGSKFVVQGSVDLQAVGFRPFVDQRVFCQTRIPKDVL